MFCLCIFFAAVVVAAVFLVVAVAAAVVAAVAAVCQKGACGSCNKNVFSCVMGQGEASDEWIASCLLIIASSVAVMLCKARKEGLGRCKKIVCGAWCEETNC